LTVERLEDGEVSPYLVDELRPGDELELRGPIGGYFVWDDSFGGPVALIAGGSGIAPFRAMLRHRVAAHPGVRVRVLYSAPSLPEVIYHDELLRLGRADEVNIRFALTRKWPEEWSGHRGRIDRRLLADAAGPPGEPSPALTFACGPSGFVEFAASTLVELGHRPDRIRTERFGPTG
jgi:ferredoxin-NADP reductase